jgi:hypothetical protein
MKNNYYERRLKWWLIEDALIRIYGLEVRRFALKLANQLAHQQYKVIRFKRQMTYQQLLKSYIRQVEHFEKEQDKQ